MYMWNEKGCGVDSCSLSAVSTTGCSFFQCYMQRRDFKKLNMKEKDEQFGRYRPKCFLGFV